jgi:hypothetical protein
MSSSPPDGSPDDSADDPTTPGHASAPVRARPPGADDVIGSYRVLRLIGEGAVGHVFEVEHVKIGRRAAMKVLSPEHAVRPMALRRLFAEAQAVNRINHPHIVEITDVVEAERPGAVSGVVMELLEGKSLAQVIETEGPLAPGRFIPILRQVADALAAAHAAGFVHRDLKPENIFITEREGQQDYVKLLDFGLAKSLSPELPPAGLPGAPRLHKTVEGTFLGTPAYASPEQACGKPVDHRSDIYSLGVILYELLCGRLPFEGANLGEYLVKHITEDVPPAPAKAVATPLGQSLDHLARACLEKEPGARVQSADDVKATLEHLVRGGFWARPGRGWWRRPRLLIAASAVLALGLAAAARPIGRRSEPPAAAPAPEASAAAPTHGPVIEPLGRATLVFVKFQSVPAGAEIRRVGEPTLLGTTPTELSFPSGPGKADFELSLAGYEPWRYTLPLVSNATVVASLQQRGRPPVRRPPRAASREGTLDPFSR